MRNSKVTKGIAAGALGLTLLLGGGTFALWYDTETVASGNVSSGELTLAVGAQQWSNATGNINLATYKVVPGDVLTLKTTLNITAVGDNLKAKLAVNTASLTGDAQLASALKTSLSVTGLADGAGTSGVYQVVTGDSGKAVSATLKITFPATKDGAAPAANRSNWYGSEAQKQTVNLGSVTFDLTQTLA